jgi:hypothetical protein
MRAELRAPGSVQDAASLTGAVLLAPVTVAGEHIPKGSRVNPELAARLAAAARAGSLMVPLRLGWLAPGELHEDEAARRLARAVAGSGVSIAEPLKSRVDLRATTDGVLRVEIAALARINRVDPLEVFTLFHGQAVRAGQIVAAAKVAPHIVAGEAVAEAEAVVAELAGSVISVAPYLALEVSAIAAEALPPDGLERFDRAARAKVEGLGGRFLGTRQGLGDRGMPTDESATGQLGEILRALALERRVAIILVGGVSAGDPLSPFYTALERLGGRMLRRGVPAHPGSMIWLATLGQTTVLGLPQCGMFSKATAADLVLPRLLTGERVTALTLADLGHGGLLGPEMRFRFPDYARDLESPE